MRAILLILILAIVGLIAAIATGYINISQTREARAPTLEAADGGVRAKAGQSPAFEVQTGSVEVGTRDANVSMPSVEVKQGTARVRVPSVEVRSPDEASQNTAR